MSDIATPSAEDALDRAARIVFMRRVAARTPPTPGRRRRAEAEAIYHLLRSVTVDSAAKTYVRETGSGPTVREYVKDLPDGWKQIVRVSR